MGINIDVVISFTFGLGSALAGAAGILTSIQQPSIDPLMGVNAGLKAFVAAVLGGIGNIPGAALGGVLIGLLEALVVGYINPTYRDAIVFARPHPHSALSSPPACSGKASGRKSDRHAPKVLLLAALVACAVLSGFSRRESIRTTTT